MWCIPPKCDAEFVCAMENVLAVYKRPYDPDRPEPFLFHPGDRVRFHRIPATEYRSRTEWGDV